MNMATRASSRSLGGSTLGNLYIGGEAARMLGLHRGTVGRWCKKLGIDPVKARADNVRLMVEQVAAK
jgi:hypothetical protein